MPTQIGRTHFLILVTATTLATTLMVASQAIAAEPTSSTKTAASSPSSPSSQSDPKQLDRDGKHICGYNLMSDSERAGMKSMMHNTKELADRDTIRMENCKAMRKRAQEKGVALDE